MKWFLIIGSGIFFILASCKVYYIKRYETQKINWRWVFYALFMLGIFLLVIFVEPKK